MFYYEKYLLLLNPEPSDLENYIWFQGDMPAASVVSVSAI